MHVSDLMDVCARMCMYMRVLVCLYVCDHSYTHVRMGRRGLTGVLYGLLGGKSGRGCMRGGGVVESLGV